MARLSESLIPSRDSCSWVREDRDESLSGTGGLLWTPAYSAEGSSHVGEASRLKESRGSTEGQLHKKQQCIKTKKLKLKQPHKF